MRIQISEGFNSHFFWKFYLSQISRQSECEVLFKDEILMSL